MICAVCKDDSTTRGCGLCPDGCDGHDFCTEHSCHLMRGKLVDRGKDEAATGFFQRLNPELEVCHVCGGALTFDSTRIGETCGGITLRGWLVCACGEAWLSYRALPVEHWRLNAGGRSVDVGVTRVRCEKFVGDPGPLLARISRVPAIEFALECIAQGGRSAVEMSAIARLALGRATKGDPL